MADWNNDITRYLDYDLTGNEPQLHSSCSLAAVRADTVDLATGTALPDALELLRAPDSPPGTIPLLRAPAGIMAEPGGLYHPSTVATWPEQFPALRVTTIPGTNHYSILLGPAVADAVAAAVQRELASEGARQ